MSNIQDWKQANTDIALVQAGSLGAPRAAFVFGARSGRAELVGWEDARWGIIANNPAYVTQFDHFNGGTLSTQWLTNLSTGATIAINAQLGGAIRFSTDTDDNDFATLTGQLNWQVQAGWTYFVAKVKSNTAITVRAIEVGISDAVSETNGLAFSNHAVGGVTAVADDAVIFGYDTDASMTTWAVNTVNAAGTPTATDTGVAPTLTYQTFEIVVDADGNAWFYLDGDFVTLVETAIATTATVTAWVSLKSLSGAIKTIDADYVGISGTATN